MRMPNLKSYICKANNLVFFMSEIMPVFFIGTFSLQLYQNKSMLGFVIIWCKVTS